MFHYYLTVIRLLKSILNIKVYKWQLGIEYSYILSR